MSVFEDQDGLEGLRAVALGEAALPSAQDHLARCPDCRLRLKQLHAEVKDLRRLQTGVAAAPLAPGSAVSCSLLLPRAGRILNQYSNLAGWHLAELGADAAPALPVLRAAVFERQPPSESALQALAKLGEPGVLILAKALGHVEPWVRRSAAHCLGVLGLTAQSAVPALEAARADRDRTVRHAVTDALIRIGYAGEQKG